MNIVKWFQRREDLKKIQLFEDRIRQIAIAEFSKSSYEYELKAIVQRMIQDEVRIFLREKIKFNDVEFIALKTLQNVDHNLAVTDRIIEVLMNDFDFKKEMDKHFKEKLIKLLDK